MGGVGLNPSNKKGGYYFMSIRTGRKLHGFVWKELPITEEVITRVEDLGK